jgi:hypothetical protein
MLRWRQNSICTDWYSADELKKPHGSIQIVRMWCGIHTDPILGCFDNPGDELRELANRRGSRSLELANGLRLSTAVPSKDLSGA